MNGLQAVRPQIARRVTTSGETIKLLFGTCAGVSQADYFCAPPLDRHRRDRVFYATPQPEHGSCDST
jgi:hypothetical protein